MQHCMPVRIVLQIVEKNKSLIIQPWFLSSDNITKRLSITRELIRGRITYWVY